MKPVVLGSSGLEYLQSVLRTGDYLATYLAGLPFAGGQTFTWAPDEVQPSEISLVDGGLSRFDFCEDLWSPVIDMVDEFLRRSPQNLAIVESAGVSPQIQPSALASVYPALRFITLDTSRHKAEGTPQRGVYRYLTGTESSPENVSTLIDAAYPFHPVLALTSVEDMENIASGKLVDKGTLRALALRAQTVVVGAYDGDGVVVWSARQSQLPG